jgi:hypothetical protein
MGMTDRLLTRARTCMRCHMHAADALSMYAQGDYLLLAP